MYLNRDGDPRARIDATWDKRETRRRTKNGHTQLVFMCVLDRLKGKELRRRIREKKRKANQRAERNDPKVHFDGKNQLNRVEFLICWGESREIVVAKSQLVGPNYEAGAG